jgi:choline kinase
MIAILYAAGRGSRLGLSAGTPHKILLEFDGCSLLERHVMHLSGLGVPRLFVVTGHEREALATICVSDKPIALNATIRFTS